MASARLAVALAVTLGLAGCMDASNRAYRIDGHTFHGFEDAAAYVRAKNEERFANVQPLPAPIAGPALIVVPTRAQIVRALGVATPFWDDHEIQQLVELYSYSYRSIERRNIFQSVQHTEAESPEGTQVPPQGYLILVRVATLRRRGYWHIRSHCRVRRSATDHDLRCYPVHGRRSANSPAARDREVRDGAPCRGVGRRGPDTAVSLDKGS